ncbi:HAD-like domain-containing protein [Aspergillus caelatus]|uniref:HAD-like domain-containing protein n=2 Tax=Aspergillus subgen. Circumdati TaxID=2720871 RepID=A0A5N7A1N6_9EURO|nr:HAD-like domain-containing protein [Aspergillus caelatus]KAE8363774.1 HAD-like domain-containing protein [Aspergillus caelatus]KAE8415022.1 HAD-like domain-containing protein [Aspergillus pseudocaelatus]
MPHVSNGVSVSEARAQDASLPADAEGNIVEVPSTRSAISDVQMQALSLSPSMKDRRASRNSFGVSLPIPRSSRPSRLSSVTTARDHVRDIVASEVQDKAAEKVKAVKNMAFCFDIDGVLAHGNIGLQEAKEALRILNGDNELGIQFPYILLTNGGGKTEEARCAQLSDVLGHPISTNQFIQSHTPMQALAEYYENVLVCGGEGFNIRKVAESYGFKNVVHPKDILAWDPTISLCRNFTEEERAQAKPRDFSEFKFDAILVLAESYDMSTDFQIILDLLLSANGKLMSWAKDPASKNAIARHIPIYFSQGDLLSPTEHKGAPRLHLGAFRVALEAQYKALTGLDLDRLVYGKPERATYICADEVFKNWMEEIHNERRLPENIYMIGDNPQSDIIGGNLYGWNTCLVRTGVFRGEGNDANNPANFGVFDHVLDAVKAAIRKELGEDFKFKWDPQNLAPNGGGSAVE